MRIKLFPFKSKDSYAELHKFYFSMYYRKWDKTVNLFYPGRIYCGYVGLISVFKGFHFDILIHYPNQELREREA